MASLHLCCCSCRMAPACRSSSASRDSRAETLAWRNSRPGGLGMVLADGLGGRMRSLVGSQAAVRRGPFVNGWLRSGIAQNKCLKFKNPPVCFVLSLTKVVGVASVTFTLNV
jgi:hypothetical protein